MDVEIRPARVGEEQALLPLYEWLFEPPGRRPPGWEGDRAAAALGGAIDSEDAAVLVAATGEGLVGLCVAYQDIHSVRFGRRVWIEDLAVDPDSRSQGIGARLIAAASEWARQRGATHLELDTGEARTDSQRFYERLNPEHRGISYTWEL